MPLLVVHQVFSLPQQITWLRVKNNPPTSLSLSISLSLCVYVSLSHYLTGTEERLTVPSKAGCPGSKAATAQLASLHFWQGGEGETRRDWSGFTGAKSRKRLAKVGAFKLPSAVMALLHSVICAASRSAKVKRWKSERQTDRKNLPKKTGVCHQQCAFQTSSKGNGVENDCAPRLLAVTN